MFRIVKSTTPGSTVADRIWCYLDNRPGVMLAETRETLTMAQLEERTAAHWTRHDRLNQIDAEFKRVYPTSAIYGTFLPTSERDVANRPDLAPGYYIVALSSRRRAGKYQIIAARQ